MKIAVTGAAGFVGSNISKKLLADGHDVIGIDSLTDYYDLGIKRRNLELLSHECFEFVNADINFANLNEILDGVDAIFHQAGQPGVRKSWGADFGVYLDANVAATQRLLEWCRSAPFLKKFVYASSSSVYGNAARFPSLESDVPKPLSPYGVTKLAGEHLCSLYAENFGIPTVALRYFTVYGPGQRPDMAFTRFTLAAAGGEPIYIYGTGEQVRDFTFVDDVVNANIMAAFSDTEPGSIFNVAGGSSISVNGVLELLGEIADTSLDIRYIDAVAGDVKRTGGGIDLIQKSLGWKPQVEIGDGLKLHFEWAQETRGLLLRTNAST